MLWIVLLMCLGVVGWSGYRRGPICAGFSLVGLLAGMLLAEPLSPLTRRLVAVVGVGDPLWKYFLPDAIAFLAVLLLFKIVGNVLHQKISAHFKYDKDENLYFRWERLYSRLGFCVGLVNGAVYFFILMMPIYVGGYFLNEAGEAVPASGRLIASLYDQLHDSHLDRVLAAHDRVPTEIYQASDILDLVLQNPPLETRLENYPAFLTLARQKEFRDIASDPQLQQMFQSHASLRDIIASPKIQGVLTNDALMAQLRDWMGRDFADLQEYLNTGKSPKYEGEKILGVWSIDARATWEVERAANPSMTASQMAKMRETFIPLIRNLALASSTDNQTILERENSGNTPPAILATGTWKNTGDSYELNLPGNKPDTVMVTPTNEGVLRLNRDGHTLVFQKEM